MLLKKHYFLYTLAAAPLCAVAQESGQASVTVRHGAQALPAATVELRKLPDSALVKIGATDASGAAQFGGLRPGTYFFRVSHAGYERAATASFQLNPSSAASALQVDLQPAGTLAGVTVTARRPFIEQKTGKTVVNLESSITSVGSTVAEALERLPGVSLDKDGNLALKGRSGVNVYIDGKPSNLSGAELATLLQGMSASNISQIELLDQPPARYEAAGGAGVINIITKRTRQKGFNGSLSTGITQGRYTKTNNSLTLAWRRDRWSINTGYSLNAGRGFTHIDALRTYYNAAGAPVSLVEQPSQMNGNNYTHNLRANADFAASSRTSLYFAANGLLLKRTSDGNNSAEWKQPGGAIDSILRTESNTATRWRNGGLGLGLRHAFSSARNLSIDLDGQWYRMQGDQYFANGVVLGTGSTQAYRSDAPGALRILSARADYSARLKAWSFETGTRWAVIRTDNEVRYEADEGAGWRSDAGRSNHFLYEERIGAGYGSAEWKGRKWTLQGGLRFEATSYDARQLGNAIVKDSAFSRSYSSLFPTMLLSFEADSNHSWSLSAGRRIDRPPFQKLNPFSFFINKYTVQRGNPYFRPQYSWNLELTHNYRGWLLTGIGYSITTDYFAQLFPVEAGGIVVYTEGNLGQLRVLSLTVGVQRAPVKWWNLSASLLLQHKWQEGFVEQAYTAQITQGTLNVSNTFRFGKGWSAELSGLYVSRSQNDIQEIVDPAGQLSVGVSKTILKGAGTLRLAGRDLLYTQWMKGNTEFRGVSEWFKMVRDTRVVALNFSWRFGKAFKQTKRSGSAGEEVQRVGNG
ncbi:outer membrane beta-barrel protein [Flaviaesturariibacter aridisoli]|nr:outer membrane beta-barrel protein [Flaviaesturariibacter aridisoli]